MRSQTIRMLGMSAVMKQPGGYWNLQYTRGILQFSNHLENGQRVYFTEDNALDRASGDPPKTTLTEFFALCRVDSFAKTLLYVDVPKYYTSNNKSWRRRKQGTDVAGFAGVKEAHVLGRVHTINPRQGECFYLRLLLHHIRGPQSFAELKTVEVN